MVHCPIKPAQKLLYYYYVGKKRSKRSSKQNKAFVPFLSSEENSLSPSGRSVITGRAALSLMQRDTWTPPPPHAPTSDHADLTVPDGSDFPPHTPPLPLDPSLQALSPTAGGTEQQGRVEGGVGGGGAGCSTPQETQKGGGGGMCHQGAE